MKKVIIIVAVVFACVVLGIGVYCYVSSKNKKDDMNTALYIKHSTFVSSETQEKSNKEKEKYEVEKGKKINLTGIVGELEIEVIDISKDEIKIRTSENMSIEENGVMDLVETKNEFVIKKDDKIRLITPTTDTYDMYEIEYR